MRPFSSIGMASAGGLRGRPGMVMMSPQMTTTISAAEIVVDNPAELFGF